ncbi:MAG: DUF4405 domain-containing protein [Verrucomicrobiota bacterium]
MKILLARALNLLLYLSFCTMAGTGLLMAFRLIPGSRGGQGLEVWGWSRHEWGDLHTWISYVFIALIAIHLVLHWAWLTKCAASGHLWRLIVGLAVGLAIIAAFLLLPVRHRERGKGHGRRGDVSAFSQHSRQLLVGAP